MTEKRKRPSGELYAITVVAGLISLAGGAAVGATGGMVVGGVSGAALARPPGAFAGAKAGAVCGAKIGGLAGGATGGVVGCICVATHCREKYKFVDEVVVIDDVKGYIQYSGERFAEIDEDDTELTKQKRIKLRELIQNMLWLNPDKRLSAKKVEECLNEIKNISEPLI